MKQSKLITALLTWGWSSTAASLVDPSRGNQTTFKVLGNECRDLVGGRSVEKVGKVCTEVNNTHISINVGVRRPGCLLSKVRFCNLPFFSPDNISKRGYSFQLRTEVIESYVCGFDGGINHILGDATAACTHEDGVEELFNDHFEIPIECTEAVEEALVEKKIIARPTGTSALVKTKDATSATYSTSSRAGLFDMQGNFTSTRNFHLHIPKAGGHSAKEFGIFLMSQLFGIQGRKSICENGGGIWKDPTGAAWKSYTYNMGHCVLVTGEHSFTDLPERSFTIMRDPVEHVLSQYFHCTESDEIKLRLQQFNRTEPFVPSLDEWLDRWANVLRGTRHAPMEYKCYDPQNLQSKFLSHPEGKKDLLERFEVVGISSRMKTSVCLEVIQLTGLLPPSCNCTASEHDRRRHLGEIPHIDHGVVHHGGSYKPTSEQLNMIRELTQKDRMLYDAAKEIFAEQVAKVEQEHDIVLC